MISASMVLAVPIDRVMMFRKGDACASSRRHRADPHLLGDPGMVLGDLRDFTIAYQISAAVADLRDCQHVFPQNAAVSVVPMPLRSEIICAVS